MDTKALRQKILDLAIRGKLVPQDPNDEPASVLLERIREQKKQMVKEGKLKEKDIKNDTVIFVGEDNSHYEKFPDGTVKCIEDEIPFEVPEGWEWCRLSDLFSVCSAKRVLQSDWKTEGVPFYRAREIVKLAEKGTVENELFISEEHYQNMIENYGIPQENDLMVSAVGTIGKIYIVKSQDRFYYKDASVICFQNTNNIINSKYAKIMLESSFLQQQMVSNSKGTTVDTITISTAQTYLCALPPLNEQINIVLAVEKVFTSINNVKENKDELKSLISNVKSKILDLAIRGKLVLQDPDDESASVLLERIRAEKEDLIKRGKIKRDKKESIIFRGEDNSYYEKMGDGTVKCIEDELPFELPEGWHYERLGNVTNIARGGSPRPIEKYLTDREDGLNWIKIGDTEKDGKYISSTKEKIIPEGLNKTRLVSKGDFLLTNSMSFGRPYILKIDGCIHDGWLVIGNIKNVFETDFLYYALSSNFMYQTLNLIAAGSTVKNLKSDSVKFVIFPIPPLSEQKRIIEKCSEIMKLLRNIEKSLR